MDENNILLPEKEALTLIKNHFSNEVNGDIDNRIKIKKELLNHLIKTDDGSYTLNSQEVQGRSETMHTSHGAITESLEKFVKPIFEDNNLKKINVLDICCGFGYNSAALIEYLDISNNLDIKLNIDLIEISLETLAMGLVIPSPIKSHLIIKKAIENKLINENYAYLQEITVDIPQNINLNIFTEDARKTIKKLNDDYYDAIFLDPFSPSKSPELYTVEFFKELSKKIKFNGMIATYTSSAPVRSGLIEAGFFVGQGPVYGRKSGGTLASLNHDKLKTDLTVNDERMIALSDAGIPFHDFDLKQSANEIFLRRKTERTNARNNYKLSSAVKTPIYLGKNINMDKVGRRVIRNINQLNIPNTISDEAYFLICPQSKECICNCKSFRFNNSTERIIEMKKRLSKLVS